MAARGRGGVVAYALLCWKKSRPAERALPSIYAGSGDPGAFAPGVLCPMLKFGPKCLIQNKGLEGQGGGRGHFRRVFSGLSRVRRTVVFFRLIISSTIRVCNVSPYLLFQRGCSRLSSASRRKAFPVSRSRRADVPGARRL